MTSDLRLSDFDFDLPPSSIAQEPVTPRDRARLLRVAEDTLGDHHVTDLPNLLRAGDLLVMNATKVIPARIYGKRGEVSVEVLLHKKGGDRTWLAFARPGKRLKAGDTISFAAEFSAKILEKRDGGEIRIRFSADDRELPTLLDRYGEMPLPPYIKRPPGGRPEDRAAYQTVYAEHAGAVAAPTAGLHFTPELLRSLKTKGIETAQLTLHVGAGTFLPIKTDRVKDHVMHAEWGEIDEALATRINRARAEGRRIVAVGTTSLRLLESAADARGTVRPFRGDTDIFITPGYSFKTADLLMTNFHLPKSTLFMLVCAFMGTDRMRDAYRHATEQGYRFYSYGDASLLGRTREEGG